MCTVTGVVEVTYAFVIPGYDGLAVARVSAEIADNEAAGVRITQTDGSTNVIEVRDGIPMTFPTAFTNAPPELPGLIAASV